jgi:hypothetical protein
MKIYIFLILVACTLCVTFRKEEEIEYVLTDRGTELLDEVTNCISSFGGSSRCFAAVKNAIKQKNLDSAIAALNNCGGVIIKVVKNCSGLVKKAIDWFKKNK